MKRKATIKVRLALTAFLCLAWAGTAEAIEGADIPPPGMYWRSPLPDTLSNLNVAVGSTLRLHAAPIELARVERVVYFAGGIQVGQVTNPPYAFNFTAAGNGSVTLRAEARDEVGTVQGWCEKTIYVVGDGLRVAQSEIAVTVAKGASTTVTLNLMNLGPANTEWALHVQGGTAPGGTNGRIVKSFSSNIDPLYGAFTYRHRGTTSTNDDEMLIKDNTALGDYKLRRRAVSNWADLGIFTNTSGDKISSYCQFDTDGDRYWSYHMVNTPSGYVPGFSLIDAASKAELRRIQVDNGPGIIGTSVAAAAFPKGVVYCASPDTYAGAVATSLWQARSRDGHLIAGHGVVPSLHSAIASPSAAFVCWKDGHVWFYGPSTRNNEPSTTVKLWRWTPGMADAVEVVSWTTTSATYHGSSGICPAAEPGFLWVFTSELNGERVQRVDTGYRPWLLPVTEAGTLANGASQSVTVQINASTAPTGTYHGVLAFTQYPNSLLPQITVPVTLTVASGPIANTQSVFTAEDSARAITLTCSNPVGTNLTYTVLTQPTNGTLAGTAPNLTYTPNTNFNGSDNFTFKVNDGVLESATATVLITVTSVNDAPICALTVPTNGATYAAPASITLQATASDLDGTISKVEFFKGTNKLGQDTTSPYAYTWNNVAAGSYALTVKASDNNSATTTSTVVNITVTSGANQPPVITEGASVAVTMSEDSAPTPFSRTLHATDANTNTLTWSISSAAAHGTATASGTGASKVIGYTPVANYNGADSFVVQVSDGQGGTDTIIVNVTIQAVNDAPTVSTSVSTNSGIAPLTVTFTANGADVDGDTLSYSWTFGDGGTSTTQNPSHVYASAGSYTSRVTVADGRGGSASMSMLLVVTGASSLSPYEQWQRAYFTTQDLMDLAIYGDNADPDHDGMSNLQEYLAGTIPTNRASCLVFTADGMNPLNAGQFIVRWQSASNKLYTLQAATNLVNGFTLIVRTNIPATPPENVHTDNVQSVGQRFYRVLLE